MKKKLISALLIPVAIVSLPSCGGSSPVDAVVKMYQEATEQAKKATSSSEATAIEDKLYDDVEKYCKEHGINDDYEPDGKELEKLFKAEKEFYEAIDALK